MIYRETPYFVIKKNLQKSNKTRVYFSDAVTPDVLKDVCYRITGQTQFEYNYVENDHSDEFLTVGYNKGRIAVMQYRDEVCYISFSEPNIGGRNSSVQSVPTAYNIFYSNRHPKKKLYYYFLNAEGNTETEYHIFIYRLMSTIGFVFLNSDEKLRNHIVPFRSIDDIIFSRTINAKRNHANNSTFINKVRSNEYEVYGKTYGANKYETSLICYAMSILCEERQHITLYEVVDGDLRVLPKVSLDVIHDMKKIAVIPTNLAMEKQAFENEGNLRSPRYIYNLFEKLGNKRCALCNCEIPELIQGAHIWPVSDIKRTKLTGDEKFSSAIDGDNGIWLCENHHKMFDEHLLTFNDCGEVVFKDGLDDKYEDFMEDSVSLRDRKLPKYIMTQKFLEYLHLRDGI